MRLGNGKGEGHLQNQKEPEAFEEQYGRLRERGEGSAADYQEID